MQAEEMKKLLDRNIQGNIQLNAAKMKAMRDKVRVRAR